MLLKIFDSRRLPVTLLILFYLATYILPLGSRQMIRPDEFRYAEIPREMLASGNWITPKLVDVRYFEKPALGYQLTALSFKYFGENAFALRLPSALAVGITALLLFGLLKTNSSDPRLPVLATGIYLLCGLVYGVGTFAVLDSQLTAALTLTIGFFYFAWSARTRMATVAWLAAAGAAAGAAFLLKGLLAFAVPTVVIVPFLLWQKEWKKIFVYPWLPFAAALLVALPWALAIHHQEPDFWRYFIEEEHFNRFTGNTYDRDPEPFWYFIPVLLGGMLPAGLYCAAAWMGWKRELFRRPLYRFLLCWAVLPFLLFSASSCKLGTYILPCFPPLAALIAAGTLEAFRLRPGSARKILDITFKSLGLLLAALAVIATVGLIVWRFIPALPELYSKWNLFPYLTLLALLAWGVALIRSRRWTAPVQSAVFLFGMAPAIVFGLNAVPDIALGDKATAVGIRQCLEEIPVRRGDIILVDRGTLQATAWLLKRTDLVLIGKPGELQYGLNNYPEYASRWYKEEETDKLLAASHPGSRLFITLRNLKKKPLPPDWAAEQVVTRNGISVIRF